MHGNFNERSIASDLLLASASSTQQHQEIQISILVSREDGTIFDAKFNCQAPPFVIGICELILQHCIRKTYAQLQQIGSEYIEQVIKDKTKQILPTRCYSFLNTLIDLFDTLTEKCKDIPVHDTYLETPIEESLEQRCIEDFFDRPEKEQLSIVNSVIEQQVQPYVALDKGSVAITNIDGHCITISYDGSCTSCVAATGSTLDAIGNILRARIHPSISVQVDPKTLSRL